MSGQHLVFCVQEFFLFSPPNPLSSFNQCLSFFFGELILFHFLSNVNFENKFFKVRDSFPYVFLSIRLTTGCQDSTFILREKTEVKSCIYKTFCCNRIIRS